MAHVSYFFPKILSLLVLHLCSEVYLFQKHSGLFTNFANLNLFKSMQILFQTNAFSFKNRKGKWFEQTKKAVGGTNRHRPRSGPGPASPPRRIGTSPMRPDADRWGPPVIRLPPPAGFRPGYDDPPTVRCTDAAPNPSPLPSQAAYK
jgi:hypothetical protein